MQPFMVVIMLLSIAKEVLSKQATFNNILYTEVSSQLFYSLSIVFFVSKFPLLTLKAVLHFHYVCWGHASFESKRYKLPSNLKPKRRATRFFSS